MSLDKRQAIWKKQPPSTAKTLQRNKYFKKLGDELSKKLSYCIKENISIYRYFSDYFKPKKRSHPFIKDAFATSRSEVRWSEEELLPVANILMPGAIRSEVNDILERYKQGQGLDTRMRETNSTLRTITENKEKDKQEAAAEAETKIKAAQEAVDAEQSGSGGSNAN